MIFPFSFIFILFYSLTYFVYIISLPFVYFQAMVPEG